MERPAAGVAHSASWTIRSAVLALAALLAVSGPLPAAWASAPAGSPPVFVPAGNDPDAPPPAPQAQASTAPEAKGGSAPPPPPATGPAVPPRLRDLARDARDLPLPPPGQPAQPPPRLTRKQIDDMIRRAQEYLLTSQNPDGTWGQGQAIETTTPAAVAALVSTSVSCQNPQMEKSLAWMKRTKAGTPESRAWRCLAWHHASGVGDNFDAEFERELGDAIKAAPRQTSPYTGSAFWHHMAIRSGILRKSETIIAADLSRLGRLLHLPPGGTWPDPASGQPSLHETIGGYCLARTCWDFVQSASSRRAPSPAGPPPLEPPALTNTMAALETGLRTALAQAERMNEEELAELLCRVRVLCGETGRWDWGDGDVFARGTGLLHALQKPDGRWGRTDPARTTALALLFLQAAQEPLLIAQFRYAGNWNPYPQAVANLQRWLHAGFVCVAGGDYDIVDADTLLSGPNHRLLLISGAGKPAFTPRDVQALRTFVQRGGTIFCNGPTPEFSDGMAEWLQRLLPDYPLVPAPADHPIYACRWKLEPQRSRLYLIENGVRPLAVFTPVDLGVHWQMQKVASQRWAFETACNVAASAIDGAETRADDRPWLADRPVQPRATILVARLGCERNWNAEPAAWELFRLRLLQWHQVGLDIRAVGPGDLARLQPDIAVLSGTGRLKLSDQDRAALKQYVAAGGTLLVEALGGSREFGLSAREALIEMFGQGWLQELPLEHPVYNLPGMRIQGVQGTPLARRTRAVGKVPVLWGVPEKGRTAVIFSELDLTAGQLGLPLPSVAGYQPASAYDLLRNIVLYSALKPARAATTTQP